MGAIFALTLLCSITLTFAQEDACKEYCEKFKEFLTNLDDSKIPQCYKDNKEKWDEVKKEMEGMSEEEKMDYMQKQFSEADKEEVDSMLQCVDQLFQLARDEGMEEPPAECAEQMEKVKSFMESAAR